MIPIFNNPPSSLTNYDSPNDYFKINDSPSPKTDSKSLVHDKILNYLLQKGAIDKNGCLNKRTRVLIASEIPEIIAESEELTVSLGDSVFLNVTTNLSDQTVIWTPDQEIGCKTCLKTYVLPINNTNFEISVMSKDGCEKKVTISVVVNKKRSFTISNVFSPNNDGNNDLIRYFAGKDVIELRDFRIYDRWGNLIYLRDNQSSGLEYMDWDGNYKGQPLPSGVYTWVCEVVYIDHVNIIYKGTMSILR